MSNTSRGTESLLCSDWLGLVFIMVTNSFVGRRGEWYDEQRVFFQPFYDVNAQNVDNNGGNKPIAIETDHTFEFGR